MIPLSEERMAPDNVRVRFAPSPTGYLHAGGARTALFNYLFARHHGGSFILRIEDTDRTRYTEEALYDFMDSLRWLGVLWDEGPEVGGDYGPYFQSQRLRLYKHYAEELIQKDAAYRCYCSTDRLEAMRGQQTARKEPPGYDRHCRSLTAKQIADYEAQGIVPVVRLKVPLEGETRFHDLIRGEITVENRTLDDLVLLKSDGFPTYHLGVVVDDHLMEISHILRADEWIPSAPRHQLIYDAFGWTPPIYAHLPVILDPSGRGKMSKRKKRAPDGKELLVSIHEFRTAGYLPEAMFNFLALVGWAYDDKTDILTPQQIIDKFDLESITASPAAFSYDKLEWMNGVYIRSLPVDQLAARIQPVLARAGRDADLSLVEQMVPLIRERIKTLNDVVPMTDFFFSDPQDYDPRLLLGKKLSPEAALAALARATQVLATVDFTEEALDGALRTGAESMGMKAGDFFAPIRVAVTGKVVSPPLFGTLVILGRDRVLKRLETAIKRLSDNGNH
jgi:glutamyl-tRNA synthetase